MRNLFFKILFFIFLFSFFSQKSLAATFTFTNAPPSISDNQSFIINVALSISGSSGDVYYIRGDFASVNTTAYFGFTQDNNGGWYNGKPTLDYTKFFKVTMVNNQWNGTIQFKPDTQDSGYKGPGNYNFKLRRYKTSLTSYVWSDNIAQLTITSSATPTPVPSQTPTPTQAPFSSPQSSTPVPTDSPSPTSLDSSSGLILSDSTSTNSTVEPKATSLSVNIFDLKPISSSKSVLPVSTKSSSPPSSPKSKEEKFLAKREINPSKILIVFGIIIILSGAGIYLKSLIK